MAGKQGPETRIIAKMRQAGKDKYGDALVTVKYHGNQFGEAGVSDLLCCLMGVFVAIEAKSPETKYGKAGATPKQLAFGARVAKAGGIFAVCNSVESFLEALAEAENVARTNGVEQSIAELTDYGPDGCL